MAARVSPDFGMPYGRRSLAEGGVEMGKCLFVALLPALFAAAPLAAQSANDRAATGALPETI